VRRIESADKKALVDQKGGGKPLLLRSGYNGDVAKGEEPG